MIVKIGFPNRFGILGKKTTLKKPFKELLFS